MLLSCPLSNHWNKLWIFRSLNLSSQVRPTGAHGGRAGPRNASSLPSRGWSASWCPVLCSNQRGDAAGDNWPALMPSGKHTLFGAALMTLGHCWVTSRTRSLCSLSARRPGLDGAGRGCGCRSCLTALWQQHWRWQGSLRRLQQGSLRLWQKEHCGVLLQGCWQNPRCSSVTLALQSLRQTHLPRRSFSSRSRNLRGSGTSPWGLAANTPKLGYSPTMLGLPR